MSFSYCIIFLWLGLVVFGAIICVIKFLDFLLFPAFMWPKSFVKLHSNFNISTDFTRFVLKFFWDWSKDENNLWDCGGSISTYEWKYEFKWILTPSCILPSLHWSFSKTIKPFLENAIYRVRTLFLSCLAPCYETKPPFENIFHVLTYLCT